MPPRSSEILSGSGLLSRFEKSQEFDISSSVKSGLWRGQVDYEPNLTFREHLRNSNPRFEWYRHTAVLGGALEKVVSGEIKRLMVFMPPRHGKSEEISRYFPSYYLRKHPDKWVGLCSHTADLAYGFSRIARDSYALNAELRSDVAAVKEWQTGKGGGMWAAGVGGSITGKGFHLGIIDDPLKNAEEARSVILRNGQKEWYSSTFYTREEPGGAIIVVQTRWNEDDLSGWLLESEEEDDFPEKWHIVNFAAIKEVEETTFPTSCTVEPDWRQPGEALCPERYPIEKLQKIKKRVRSYFWFALYQQHPRPQDGDLAKREWFKIREDVPTDIVALCRFWDRAGTEGGGDFTSGTLVAQCSSGPFCILDEAKGQWSPGTRDTKIKNYAKSDRMMYGDNVINAMEKAGGSSGNDEEAAFIKQLRNYRTSVRPSRGSKQEKWDPFLSLSEHGFIELLKGDWNKDFIDEMCDLPYGKHDDQADSASGAVAVLCEAEDDLPPAEIY